MSDFHLFSFSNKKLSEQLDATENEQHTTDDLRQSGTDYPQPNKQFQLVDYLKRHKLEVIDKREEGETLWVVGGWGLHEILLPLKKEYIYFRFAEQGSRATGNRPAWYLLPKKHKWTKDKNGNIPETEEKNTKSVAVHPDKRKVIVQQEEAQCIIPVMLKERQLSQYTGSPTAATADKMNIRLFSEITDDRLLRLFLDDQELFHALMTQLHIMGVTFQGNLKTLLRTIDIHDAINVDENGNKVVAYRQETLTLPKRYLFYWLRPSDFRDCRTFIRKLNATGIRLIVQVSSRVDEWHEQVQGAGTKTVELFWTQLVSLLSPERPAWLADRAESESVLPEAADEAEYPQIIRETNHGVVCFRSKQLAIPDGLKGQPLDRAHYPTCPFLIDILNENGIHTYNQLPYELSELFRIKGVGKTVVVKFTNHLQEVFTSFLQEEKLRQMTEKERLQFHSGNFIQALQQVVENREQSRKLKIYERDLTILRQYHEGEVNGKPLIQKELSRLHGVTPQRVSQIFHRIFHRASAVGKEFIEALTRVLQVTPVVRNEWFNRGNFIHYFALQAVKLEGIRTVEEVQFFTTLSEEQVDRMKEKIKTRFLETFHCRMFSNEEWKDFASGLAGELLLAQSYVQEVVSKHVYPTQQQGVYITDNFTGADLLEMVMKQFEDGVKIHRQAGQLRQMAHRIVPDVFKNDRSVTTVFHRSHIKNVYRWGPGKYIHSLHVSPDIPLLNKIASETGKMLANRPVIHVCKVYQTFQDQLEEAGVPNDRALYDLMRKHTQTELFYPRYPNISTEEKFAAKTEDSDLAGHNAGHNAGHHNDMNNDYIRRQ